MPVTINGSGSIAGLSVGGLGDGGIIDTGSLANGAVTSVKHGPGSVIQANSAVLTTVLSAYLSSMTTWRIGGTTGSSFGVTITPTSLSLIHI